MILKYIALIPARSGSKRIANKNIARVGGHPLISYSINLALKSDLFERVVVSTDSDAYADIARYYGADVLSIRPKEISGEFSPDIEWVKHTILELKSRNVIVDAFVILRPTNPNRTLEYLNDAIASFEESFDKFDSLRAVERSSVHPGKMFVIRESQLFPILPWENNGDYWHNNQTASLQAVYFQNASLEIVKWNVIENQSSLSGAKIKAFDSGSYKCIDINTQDDISYLTYLLETGKIKLPHHDKEPYPINPT